MRSFGEQSPLFSKGFPKENAKLISQTQAIPNLIEKCSNAQFMLSSRRTAPRVNYVHAHMHVARAPVSNAHATPATTAHVSPAPLPGRADRPRSSYLQAAPESSPDGCIATRMGPTRSASDGATVVSVVLASIEASPRRSSQPVQQGRGPASRWYLAGFLAPALAPRLGQSGGRLV